MSSGALLFRSALFLLLFCQLPGCGYVANTNPPSSTNPQSPPTGIKVTVSDNYLKLAGGATHQFTASVTGTDNTAVFWSFGGCSGPGCCAGPLCGTISPTGYYTAPSIIPAWTVVPLKVTSQADSSQSAGATVVLEPIGISIGPTAAMVSPGEPVSFTAKVQYDLDQLGVKWSLSCAETDCGTLSEQASTSVAYAAPSFLAGPPLVNLKATSVKDPNKSSQVAISIKYASTETLAEGDYAFIFDGWKTTCSPNGCDGVRAAIVGQFHADGKGLVTSGIEDITLQPGSSETHAITGSYEVETDHRGTLTLTGSNGTSKYRMSVGASGHEGTFITFESGSVNGLILGAGTFERQDCNAFSLPAFAGPYAFELFSSGIWGAEHQASIGRFEANSAGVLSSGRMDLQQYNGSRAGFRTDNYSLSGSFLAPATDTGRGSATLNMLLPEKGTTNSLKFTYYIVSANHILLLGTDASVPENSNTGRVLTGEARRQAAPFSVASLGGPSVFSMVSRVDDLCCTTQDSVVGQLVADGRGAITGVLDSSGNSLREDSAVLNQSFTASYTVDSDGRVVLTGIPARTSNSQIAYLFGPNQAFLMDATTEIPRFGRIEPQDEGPFTTGSISGPLVLAVDRVTGMDSEISAGWVLFGEQGAMSIAVDSDFLSFTDSNDILSFTTTLYLQGTYTVASNGRATLNYSQSPSADCSREVFWVVSPSRMVGLTGFESYGVVLMELFK